jgi:hypothetical protein
MKIIKPIVVYKCRTHKIFPEAGWGTDDSGMAKQHFYYYNCPSCPDGDVYFYLAYAATKTAAEQLSREFWNESQ